MDATGSDVRGVHSGSGHPLVELKHLGGNRSQRHGITTNPAVLYFPVAVLTFSLSSNIQKKGVMAPMSRACVVTAMM